MVIEDFASIHEPSSQLKDGHDAMRIEYTPVNSVMSTDVAVELEVGFVRPDLEAWEVCVRPRKSSANCIRRWGLSLFKAWQGVEIVGLILRSVRKIR